MSVLCAILAMGTFSQPMPQNYKPKDIRGLIIDARELILGQDERHGHHNELGDLVL